MKASRGGNNALIAGACVIFVAVVASYPVLYAIKAPKVRCVRATASRMLRVSKHFDHMCFWGPQVSLGDKPLSGDAIVRGAYVNAGSRDIGPDPQAEKYRSRPQ
jgi:hypothetical protein